MIASLIQQPESKTLEFKRDLSSPRQWLKTLVAFANSAGGRLVFGVADDRQIMFDIKSGVSQLRNPVIARVFRELELIEQWGSGIPGIFRQAKTEKLPQPTIEEIAGRIRFSVSLPEILPLNREQSRSSRIRRAQSEAQSEAQTGAESGAESALARLVACLSEHPHSKSELATRLGQKGVTGALNRTVKQLLEEGLVEYTLPDKPNSCLQKYRLAEKGRAIVNH